MAGKAVIRHGEEVRKRILDMIINYIEVHGYPPTIREIGEGVGLKSTSSVMNHMEKMFDIGMLETDAEKIGTPRAIRVPGYKFVRDGKVNVMPEEGKDANRSDRCRRT